MATKTNLINTINGYLTAVITLAKHRLSMLELINELYPTIIVDDNSSTNVLTENTSVVGLDYTTTIVKQGRKVTIKGELINNTGSIVGGGSGVYIFDITNSEFYPSGLDSAFMFGVNTGSLSNVRLRFDTNKLVLTSALGIDGVMDFTITYFTQN